MYTLGLIGNKLGHSWSQQWFEAMFRREGICGASYSLFELPNLNDIRSWAAEKKLDGFNVTIPYKQDIIPFLDELDPTVSAIGAANCIEIRQQRLIGHNTDAPAFLQTLQPLLRPCHSQALVLGSGGASKAVSFALHQLGISHIVVSRHPENGNNTIGYDQAANLANSHLLIINTTPVGMWPNTESSPWPHPHLLTPQHLCYDLIYNPKETRFLIEARQQGAATQNGLAMLHRQAELSWEHWK
ncbi:MAG: shikimate dehydrogenase [Bacteroidales bacterium]|nr:shikimate dehydrogenase [Candidatus Colimorpha merdihippi]